MGFNSSNVQPDNTTIVLDVNGKLSVAYNPNVNVVDVIASPTNLVGNSININDSTNLADSVNATTVSWNNNNATTDKRGIKITIAGVDVKLKSVTVSSNSNPTTAYLMASNHTTVLETQSLVGKVATFSGYTLAANTTYYILFDSAGASWTSDYYFTYNSYPVVSANMSFVASFSGSSDAAGYAMTVDSVTVQVNSTDLVLPSTCVLGAVIKIVGTSKSIINILQNAGQQIISTSASKTTIGTAGKVVIPDLYSCVELVCTVADTTFVITNSKGTLTLS